MARLGGDAIAARVMTRAFCLLISMFVLLLAGVPAWAQPERANAIRVSLIPESHSAAAGETVGIAFLMRPKPGWHGYWRNPGDAGAPARIAWSLPDGASAGPLLYPVPDQLIISGLMNYVFERDYALLGSIRLPPGAAPGTVIPVRARLDYLACTDRICVPETTEVAADIHVKSGPAGFENRPMMDRFRQALPRPLGSDARFERRGGQLRIAVPVPPGLEVREPYFYPAEAGVIDHAAPQTVSRQGSWLIFETEAASDRIPPERIEGVVEISDGQGLSVAAAPGAVPASGKSLSAAPDGGEARTVLLALAGAFAGGLLLNILPCVFPILSLKALSLAKAGRSATGARREGMAYTVGAVLTCLGLGAILLLLRAGGSAAGWAFQLQEPRVILVLLLLVSAIALNLAGLFRLPSFGRGAGLAGRGGSAGAFWTGSLAAFVATPCTGPFMGAALGAALVLPTAAALAVFGGLGLGLAFPFLLLGFVPALRRLLPRPGPWMETFRRLLALPMVLTALGLAWILQRQAGGYGLALGLLAVAVVAAALWAGRRHGWLPVAPALAAAAAALLLLPGVGAPAEARAGLLDAEPFSEERLAHLREERRPVFVYFTADWCLTCKVNEQAVLERDAVARAFAAKGVKVLVGDWTRGDAEIGRFLEQHGRSGVPLYLWYAPGGEARILPQILTPGLLTNLAT
jgi:thiol:disulfide interchange protein